MPPAPRTRTWGVRGWWVTLWRIGDVVVVNFTIFSNISFNISNSNITHVDFSLIHCWALSRGLCCCCVKYGEALHIRNNSNSSNLQIKMNQKHRFWVPKTVFFVTWRELGAILAPGGLQDRFFNDFGRHVGGQDGPILATCWIQDRFLGVLRRS